MNKQEDIYDVAKVWLGKRVWKTIGVKDTDFNILYKFLKRHPNYDNWIHKEPTHFKIGRNTQKSLTMEVKFKNCKRYRIVSWVCCARQKIPNHQKSDSYKLNQAMRYAVKIQMNGFRKNKKLICCLCNKNKRIEVDHYPNKFSQIRDDFLEMKNKKGNIQPNTFKYHPKKGMYMFLKGNKENNYYDNKWKTSWQRYHKKHATYRLLCSSCNKKN